MKTSVIQSKDPDFQTKGRIKCIISGLYVGYIHIHMSVCTGCMTKLLNVILFYKYIFMILCATNRNGYAWARVNAVQSRGL